MEQIPFMTDGLTSLLATFFNQIPDESENLILSTGQVLTNADLFQMAKAAAEYSSRGNFYTDVGVADTYTLAVQGIMKSPIALTEGTSFIFKVANANTGASTVELPGLASTSLNRVDNSPLLLGDLVFGDLVLGILRGASFKLFNLTQTQQAINDLGALAFLNTLDGSLIDDNTIDGDLKTIANSISQASLISGVNGRLTVKNGGSFQFINATTQLDIPNLFANSPAGLFYALHFRCRTDGNATGLGIQLYEGGGIINGAGDYGWENLSLTTQNNDPSDSQMEILPFVTTSGARILQYDGVIFVTNARQASNRTQLTGVLRASNNLDAGGRGNVLTAGRNAVGLTDGISIQINGVGGAEFNGGLLQVYAFDEGF